MKEFSPLPIKQIEPKGSFFQVSLKNEAPSRKAARPYFSRASQAINVLNKVSLLRGCALSDLEVCLHRDKQPSVSLSGDVFMAMHSVWSVASDRRVDLAGVDLC